MSGEQRTPAGAIASAIVARSTWIALLLFAAGLALRLYGLPLWGTFDTEVQKAWAARAARGGVADIYGPPDEALLEDARARGGLSRLRVPPERFLWGQAEYFVDYPPGSILVLWGAGRLYDAFYPGWPNRPAFNAFINLAPLIGSVVIAVLLLRGSPRHGRRRALLFWLNPAIILAAPVLGYQDTVFCAAALAALLALERKRYATAAALVVLAGLIKPQGVLLLPTCFAVMLREAPPAMWLRSIAAGAAAGAIVLAPWWTAGHLISAVDGALRPLGQTTLAPLGLNVWWIAGWLREWSIEGPWPLARIISSDEFRAWSGWDSRPVARMLLGGSVLGVVVLLARAPREDRRLIPLSAMLVVHAYALLGTSVHENHTFLAVVLAPLLVGVWPRAGAVLGMTSAFLFLNLFLMAGGLGRRIMRLRELVEIRELTGLDLSVIVAALHVVLVGVLAWWVLGTARGRLGPRGQRSQAEAGMV